MTQSTVPPQNLEAERGVLGGILRDPDVLPAVRTILSADHFYVDPHQKIYRALCDLSDAGSPIDSVTLYDALRQRQQTGDVTGEYLADIWTAAPTGANCLYHAKLVRDAALIRSLIHSTNEILRDAYSPTAPAEEMLASAERKLFALVADATGGTAEPRAIGPVVKEALAGLDARMAAGGSLSGLSCGYPDLDLVTGGLTPGELVVIGARPSIGKTAIALNIADRVASEGTPVLFFSLEMPATQIGSRLLAMRSGVPMHRLSWPRDLQGDDIDSLIEVSREDALGGTPLYIEDTPDQTAARVASVSRRAVRKWGVQLIVIDYLGLMRPENPKDNRTQQVGTLALRVKQMAREIGVPVLLLSQLNRESDQGQQRRPRLADLRESGDIEAHADRVILLHREPNLPPESPVWPIDLIVAKNRNGPVGDVRLAYRRPVLRFENAAA